MSIDVNKLRLTNKQVSEFGGYVAHNQLGASLATNSTDSGRPNPQALRSTPKQVNTSAGGSIAGNQLGLGKGQKGVTVDSGPDVNKLRTTNKQVTTIGGAISEKCK